MCPAGEEPTGTGRSADEGGCTECAAGKYNFHDASDPSQPPCNGCKTCPCGKYSREGASECSDQKCPVGYEPTGSGRSSSLDGCEKCEAGRYVHLCGVVY